MKNSDVLRGAEEIADFLGVDADMIYRLVRSGQPLPYYKLGRTIFARKSDLNAWVQDQVIRHAKGAKVASQMKMSTAHSDK